MSKNKSFSAKKNIPSTQKEQKSVVTESSETNSNRILIYFTAIIIAICGGLLYSNTSEFNYNLDDFSVIVENEYTVKGSAAIGDIFSHGYRTGMNFEDNLYRPLSKAMFAYEYEKSGGTPGLSHKVNIFIYSLLCGFIFLTLNRFYPKQYYLTLIASLLFAFHPIHTEVVANIKSRDEMLAMFFMIIALWFAKSYADSLKKRYIVVTGVAYFLALLSKESAITFVALLPVTLHFVSGLSISKNAVITAFILGVTATYLIIHQNIIGGIGLKQINIADNSMMITDNFIIQRMTAIEILGRYLKLLIFPHPLSCDYSFNTIPIVDSIANGGFLLALALHAGALFLALKGWKEKKVYSYAIFFYLITISIVSNVFMLIGTNMAERLVFLPSLGFCLLISYLIVWLTKSINFTPQKLTQVFTDKSFNWLIILPVIILFSAKTVSRNKDWENVKTLFDKDVKTVPESVHMLYYHANMMTNSDTLKVKTPEQLKVIYATAEKELLHALKIHEVFPEVHSTLAKVYQNTNRYPEAIKHYKRRLEMNNTDPTVYNNFGTCYGFIGNTDSAEINFKKAIELSSNCYADALVNMATVYINRGAASLQQNDKASAVKNYNIAIDYSNQTLKCDWDRPLAYKYMGMAYQGLGDLEKSKKYFQQSEQLEKNSLPK